MANVTINGITFDNDDDCAAAQALYSIELTMMAGGNVTLTQSGETRIGFGSGDVAGVRAERLRRQDLCTQSTGGRKARFAIRAGFRRIP